MSDHPTATHARHAHHLARTGDPLTAWFREAFHELELRCGVRWVDIVLDAASSPNVVARPAYVDDMLDPWGASATGVAHLSLVRGGHPSVAFVRSGDRHLAAHVFTALAVPESDIVVERLLATSFASRALLGRAGSLRSRERREFIDQAASEPKLWVLDASDAKRLLQADAVGRYLEWQSLARAHGWPALVRVTIGAARSIAMPTTSPLALEAVLEGASAAGDAPAIHVEEVIEGGWLPGVDGRHVAELVVPLRREHHLWSHLEHDAAEVRCSS